MLQRSRGLDHNQENALQSFAGASHHNTVNHHLSTKTPARTGKGGPAPVTVGKGQLMNTAARGVLGRKDGNQGKGGSKDSALLFPAGPSKPSTSSSLSAAPSQQQQTFKTPAPKPRSLRPLADLQTPATALRPKRAPVLVPSPEVEMEDQVEVEQEEQMKEVVDMGDVEVEYAGASARDYEEPFEPDFPEPDYKTAGFGSMLKGMSFNGAETHEEWEARDTAERATFEFVPEEIVERDLGNDQELPSDSIFPMPASTRRNPLASKPSNAPLSASLRSLSSSTIASSSTALSRKPLTQSNNKAVSSIRRPKLQPSLSAPSVPQRRAVPPNSLRPTNGPSALSRSTNSSSIAASATRPLVRPPPPSTGRPTSSLSTSTTTSSSALRGVASSRPPTSSSTRLGRPHPQSAHHSQQQKIASQKEAIEVERKRKLEEEEKALGAFGLSEEGSDSLLMEGIDGIGGGGFEDEEVLDLSFE